MPARAQYPAPCSEIPELNARVIQILKPWLGKTIDRGECWDAAALALDEIGAHWDGLYVYGRVVNVNTECLQPGDIIQFENVVVEVRTDKGGYREKFPHHTAIVYQVTGPGKVDMMHQNTGQFGRVMGVTKLDLSTVKTGSVIVYRPVAKIS